MAKLQAKNVPKQGKMTRREVTVSNTSNGEKIGTGLINLNPK